MMTITIATMAACAIAFGMRARTWSDRSHADLVAGAQGTFVPTALAVARGDKSARDLGRDTAPVTGVVSARLMAPPG